MCTSLKFGRGGDVHIPEVWEGEDVHIPEVWDGEDVHIPEVWEREVYTRRVAYCVNSTVALRENVHLILSVSLVGMSSSCS